MSVLPCSTSNRQAVFHTPCRKANPRAHRFHCLASLSTDAIQPIEQVKHFWEWQGHKICYTVAGCGDPVLLVHGFGASGAHFRRTVPALMKGGNKVYALDLLGFGDSEKADRDYSIELWRDLVTDFHREFIERPCVLVGNSVGSLVCLSVAATSPAIVRGTALLNCAGGMNNKARVDDWRVKLAYPLFLLLDVLLKTPWIAEPLFAAFRQPDRVRSVLESVYVNKAAVDDELVHDIICRAALDEGALKVFVSVITGPPGPQPEALIQEITGQGVPVLVLWGENDPFTPIDGPVGVFCRKAGMENNLVQFKSIPNCGHCPQDDTPGPVHDELLPWVAALLHA